MSNEIAIQELEEVRRNTLAAISQGEQTGFDIERHLQSLTTGEVVEATCNLRDLLMHDGPVVLTNDQRCGLLWVVQEMMLATYAARTRSMQRETLENVTRQLHSLRGKR